MQIEDEGNLRRIVASEISTAMKGICRVCPEHSAHEARIVDVEDKQQALRSNTGALSRLDEKISDKINKASFQVIMIATLAFIGTLFGLIYGSNRQLLNEMVVFQTTIKEKIYSNQAQMESLSAKVISLTNQVQMLVDDRHGYVTKQKGRE